MPFMMSQQQPVTLPPKTVKAPFKQTALSREKMQANKQIKYEKIGSFVKRTHPDLDIRDIAAEIYQADEKLKGNL